MPDKKDMTEADIRAMYITLAIVAAGWQIGTQIRFEYPITKGRIVVRGKTCKRESLCGLIMSCSSSSTSRLLSLKLRTTTTRWEMGCNKLSSMPA